MPDARVEPNVDFGNVSGYFIRLDVELENFEGTALPPGSLGWVTLSPDEADDLARALSDVAASARHLMIDDNARRDALGLPPLQYRPPR